MGSHQSICPCAAGFYYSSRCLICEIKAAFSCVVVVIARYVVTGSVKYPQETKVQTISTGVRSHLGRLSLCLSEVIPDLYHPDGIIKSGLEITDGSSMAKRRVLSSKLCPQTLPQQSCSNPHSNPNPAQCHSPVSLLASFPLIPSLRLHFVRLTGSLQECLISGFSTGDSFPKAITRSIERRLLIRNTSELAGRQAR